MNFKFNNHAMQINKIREDFPALKERINGMPVIYFDNACMSLKPSCVIEAMQAYYYEYPGCYGRSVHKFGNKTTTKCQAARKKIGNFINADSNEIVFLKMLRRG